MPMYVTLYNFTDQGMQAVKESPARLVAAIEAGKAIGMRVLGAYYTQGPYDLVVVSEGENEEAMAAFALSIGALGNVRSITMRGWTPDGFSKLVSMMP